MRSTTHQRGNSGFGRRRFAGRLVLLFFALCLTGLEMRAAAGGPAKSLLDHGRYKEAIAQLEPLVAKSPGNGEALAALLAAKLEVGEYRDALDQGKRFLKRHSSAAVAENTAEAAFRIGEYERAASLLEKISTPRAEWIRGLLAGHKGDSQAATAAFEQVASILRQPRRLSSEDRGLAAAALAKLGRYQEANRVYHDASKSDPNNAALKAAWGTLMERKHNPSDAQALFVEALQVNPNNTQAMVGIAELAADRWDGRSAQWLQRALTVNPNLAAAHLLLARNLLEQDEYSPAKEHLDQVLKVNPRSLEAWSLRAVYGYLQAYLRADNSQGGGAAIDRVLQENPHYGKVFADLGDFCVLKRQLPEAVQFYRRALAIDPKLDEARANLGINLSRLGQEQEARQVLEEAYRRDPYNVSTVNTLRLMDSFSRFDTFETPHFTIKLQKKEAAVLHPYVADLLETALQNLSTRYGYMPKQKITFEMYPDHDDFAVRTIGLPGLGALGATLGNVVAMDSPSARPIGTFHWGSTLWHELTHVISLGITSGRVPRWFTEGLSVYEETRSHPGWGDPMDMETVRILQKNKLIPLRDLNAAFVRPKYPGQIVFAYFQAGMICQYIDDQYGFPRILAILHAYARGRNDAEAIQDALGVSMTEFDSGFRAYARKKTYGFAQALDFDWAGPGRTPEQLSQEVAKHPENFFARLRLASLLLQQSQPKEAITQALAAQDLFPLYVGRDSPYIIAADADEALGRKGAAIAELQLWRQRKGRDPDTFKKLARLLADSSHTEDAIKVLQEAMYVSMFDVQIHNHLAEWYLESNRPRRAVREYEVVLALGPEDKAGAHYNLASAYRALSDNRNAKLQVLQALEIAPDYRPAQRLLLQLSGK